MTMPYNEAEAIEAIKILITDEKAGKRIPLTVGPYAAFLTATAIGLVQRHPQISPPMRDALLDLHGQVAQIFTSTVLQDVLMAALDPINDMPTNPLPIVPL